MNNNGIRLINWFNGRYRHVGLATSNAIIDFLQISLDLLVGYAESWHCHDSCKIQMLQNGKSWIIFSMQKLTTLLLRRLNIWYFAVHLKWIWPFYSLLIWLPLEIDQIIVLWTLPNNTTNESKHRNKSDTMIPNIYV